MPLFSSKKVSASDIVQELADSLKALIRECEQDAEKGKKSDKSADVDRNLRLLHTKFHDSDSGSEIVAQLCHEVYKLDVIPLLIQALPFVEFENRKDIIENINYLTHRKVGVRSPTVEYIVLKPSETIFELLKIYPNTDSSLHVGLLLRDFSKCEELCQLLLYSDHFYDFFELVECPVFDTATDAFSTLREFLMRHKNLCASYLSTHYDKFFDKINLLLNSENYVTKRQALKLLGEVILENQNYETMVKYVSSTTNLKTIMNLLKSKSSAIQYEAFHIFKVFVANPSKPTGVVDILMKNKSRLIQFFESFQPLKDSTDEQFGEEKEYVVKCIEQLEK